MLKRVAVGMVLGSSLLLAAGCGGRMEPASTGGSDTEVVAKVEPKPPEPKPPLKIEPSGPPALKSVTLHVEQMTEKLKLI